MKFQKVRRTNLPKIGIGVALALLGMTSGSGLVSHVFAAATAPAANDKTDSTQLANTNTANTQLGFWTGTDGDCTWKYDVLTNTLTISGAKGAQLSSTPFTKELSLAGNIKQLGRASCRERV